MFAEQVDPEEYNKKKVNRKGWLQQESSSPYKVSLGETARLRFEPESASHLLAEQVQFLVASAKKERRQSHICDSAFFGTRNRNRTCN